jgi:hypothetical protein
VFEARDEDLDEDIKTMGDDISEIPVIKEESEKEGGKVVKNTAKFQLQESLGNIKTIAKQKNTRTIQQNLRLDNLVDNIVHQGISESINLRKISVSPTVVVNYEEVAEISNTAEYPIESCTSWADVASVPKNCTTVDIDNHERVVKNAKQIYIPEIVTIDDKDSEQVQEMDKEGFVRKLSRKERHRKSQNLDEVDMEDVSIKNTGNIETESVAMKTVERKISMAQNWQEVQLGEDVGHMEDFGLNSGRKVSSCFKPSVATLVDDVYLHEYILEDHSGSTRKISVSPINMEEQVTIATPYETVAGKQSTKGDLRKLSTSRTDNYQEIISTATEKVASNEEVEKEEEVNAIQRIVSSDGVPEQKQDDICQPDLRMGLSDMPDIVLSSSHSGSSTNLASLENMSSTKMAEAVDLIRPGGQQEVRLMRQTSMEMQNAVEVQRPLSRKTSTEISPQLTPEMAREGIVSLGEELLTPTNEYHTEPIMTCQPKGKKDKKIEASPQLPPEIAKKDHLEAQKDISKKEQTGAKQKRVLPQSKPETSCTTPLQRGSLTVTLHEAKNLPKMDTFGKADPYAVINIGKECFKTETVNNTFNPVWNYTFKINTYKGEDILVEIYDADKFSRDELIGQKNINLRELTSAAKISNTWVSLQKPCKSGELLISATFIPEDTKKEKKETDEIKAKFQKKIKEIVTLKKDEQVGNISQTDVEPQNVSIEEVSSDEILKKISPSVGNETFGNEQETVWNPNSLKSKPLKMGSISIILHEAKNLPKMDTIGKGDPYAFINIGEECFKTETVNNNSNPVWNYKFKFDIETEKGEDIFVEIFDADKLSKDELIGQAHISLKEIVSQAKISKKWTVLQKPCKSGKLLYSAEFIPEHEQKQKHPLDESNSLIKMSRDTVEIPIIRKTVQTVEGTSAGVVITELSDTELEERVETPKPSSEWTHIPIKIESEKEKPKEKEVTEDDDKIVRVNPDEKVKEILDKATAEHRLHAVKDKQPKLGSSHTPLQTGIITITLHEAKNLPKMDTFGKADPYAVINIGKECFRSETVKNTCDPVWNYTFKFNSSRKTTGEDILVELFDADILTADELIGQVNINVRDIISKGKIGNKWISLQKPCKSGKLLFSADFVPEDMKKAKQVKDVPEDTKAPEERNKYLKIETKDIRN